MAFAAKNYKSCTISSTPLSGKCYVGSSYYSFLSKSTIYGFIWNPF